MLHTARCTTFPTENITQINLKALFETHFQDSFKNEGGCMWEAEGSV